MQEYRTLTALVPRIAVSTLLVLLAGTFLTNNNATGDFNKPIYLCILVLGVVVTAWFLHRVASTRLDIVLALVSSAGLVWGVSTMERPKLLSAYWEGFGYRVGVTALVFSVLLGTIVLPRVFSGTVRAGIGVIVAICCACDLLSVIRTVDFMPFVNNNVNEINDMLGPVAGKIPESTYIPEYTALYGWLFLPLKHFLSPLTLVASMSIFLTLLNVAAVVLGIWIVRRLFETHGLLIAVAIVVPITYVTSHFAGDQSSIASLFQELPIRLFSGFLVFAAGMTDLVLVCGGNARPKRLVLMGVLCGLVAWNSQDFGLAAAGVYGLVILLGARRVARKGAFGAWLGGFIAGILSYPLFLIAIGSPLDLDFVGGFVKLFGSGLGSAAIQVPGPVLIVMPIILCSAATGWALMRIRRRDGVRADALLDRATITLTAVGTWSAVCLVYYVNRAYAAGQLQTMLLPCGVCIAAMLSILIRTHEVGPVWQPRGDSPLWAWLFRNVRMLPAGIFVSLCFASALLTANPVQAFKSLVTPPAGTGYATYDLPEVIAAVHAAQQYTSDKEGELTYLGESFNYVSLVTHVPSNAALFPYPLAAISSVTQIECQYLDGHHSQWMVLSLDGLRAFGSDACGLYRAVDTPGLAYGQLQELK